jgi:hypothetical protein
MTNELRRPHTTNDEINFINTIGFNADTKMTRKELLNNYLIAALKRKNWNGMDVYKVVAHVNKLMAREYQ